jgi:O-acetyl-ADP-ribose deacetylase (regulator of RNase III)
MTTPSKITVNVIEGDLLSQSVDAIVNSWNRNIIPWWLLLTQGVSGAIKREAGSAPFIELGYRPLPLGHARLTGAGHLPFKGIIHVAGIDLLWRASPSSIADSVRNACAVAEQEGYEHIAMPVIGSGSGGMDEDVALGHMLSNLRTLPHDLEVTVVRFRVRVPSVSRQQTERIR